MQQANGTYTGDGTDGRLIVTGLSGVARRLLIFAVRDLINFGPPAIFAKTDSMLATYVWRLTDVDKPDPVDGQVALVGPNFTVGNSIGEANVPAEVYYWIAWSE